MLKAVFVFILTCTTPFALNADEKFAEPASGEIFINTFKQKDQSWSRCQLSKSLFSDARSNSDLKVSVALLATAQADGATDDPIVQSDVAICGASTSKSVTTKAVNPANLEDDGSVWRVGTNRWTQDEELKFAAWIEKNVDKDFMKRNNLATDCADAPTVIRAIYARIKSLPQIYTDGKNKVGHFSKDWRALKTVKNWTETNWQESLKSDPRFRAFINYAGADIISTDSLMDNTYPIKVFAGANNEDISPYLRAGTMIISTNHTRFISKIDGTTALSIRELHSSIPRKIRSLDDEVLASVLRGDIGRGFVNWRWAVNCGGGNWKLPPPDKMPGHNVEQYDKSSDLHARLLIAAQNPGVKPSRADVERLVSELESYVNARVEIVQQAQDYIAKNGKALSREQDDEFSTKYRDLAIVSKHSSIEAFASVNLKSVRLSDEQMNIVFANRVIDIGNGKKTSLYLIATYGLGSEATLSHEDRWRLPVLRDKYAALKAKSSRTRQEQFELEAFRKVFGP